MNEVFTDKVRVTKAVLILTFFLRSRLNSLMLLADDIK